MRSISGICVTRQKRFSSASAFSYVIPCVFPRRL